MHVEGDTEVDWIQHWSIDWIRNTFPSICIVSNIGMVRLCIYRPISMKAKGLSNSKNTHHCVICLQFSFATSLFNSPQNGWAWSRSRRSCLDAVNPSSLSYWMKLTTSKWFSTDWKLHIHSRVGWVNHITRTYLLHSSNYSPGRIWPRPFISWGTQRDLETKARNRDYPLCLHQIWYRHLYVSWGSRRSSCSKKTDCKY